MVTDRVGDFIIRLQNAATHRQARRVGAVFFAHLLAIAKKLKELGFLAAVTTDVKDGKVQKTLLVTLAYDDRGISRLHGVNRISKPGRRLYALRTLPHIR
jgi:ribosomal protein S8